MHTNLFEANIHTPNTDWINETQRLSSELIDDIENVTRTHAHKHARIKLTIIQFVDEKQLLI